ncbi:glycine/D-amino acid oxidase, deaminating [Chthonomonas calidirosea]|uniref:Glycine/D-amino acid oxidases (Deaminating) n=1 Tax=Chthonomonas calidirosea (strain DSM 23976 / ICMP 18418 / T49) TaxID=1303518 RepID=S0EUF7_CHTCT|nr:FAD-dependent oxidoreductase [Chthonomonas calidirosea]CCW34929.1 Glycine/D-amino acid oxidases (deaminating) [Chthonomonas calidirosea T49]CEK13384.1 glycine/D-amino acid oxidase, deaminating [Chthonomonas calidirosea]
MAETADVVIIGAGVIGASVAHHLATQKVGKVLLVEAQERPGLGSTRYATGGYRAQFSTAINVKLSLLSREKLRSFQEETGIDSGYRPYGYLFLARRPEQMEALRQAMNVQRAAGLSEVREVSVEEIHAINPWVSTEDIVGGTFCPTDGFTRPLQIHEGYLRSAVRSGASLLCERQVIEIQSDGGQRVRAVRTQRETIETRTVVNAAGAWAGEVAALAGVALPVWPARRQVAVSVEQPVLPDTMPMTIDVEDGFHLRVRDGRVLLLWPAETPGRYPYDVSFYERWLEGLRTKMDRRVPVLRSVVLDREACYCGLYEMSPDKHVVLGEAPRLKGFYLVNGSSGHGVMHAPILGQLVAEMILFGQTRTLDVHALRPTRFVESDLNPETGIL